MGSILPPDNVYDHAVAFKPQIKEQKKSIWLVWRQEMQ